MNILLVQTLRQQQAALSDEQFIAWANEILYALRSYYVSYRTILDILLKSDPVNAFAKAGVLAGAIQQSNPLVHQLLLQSGDSKGSAGGVNVGLSASQTMIDQLQAANLPGGPSAAEFDVVRNLGRSARRRCADWGCVQFGVAELAIVNGLQQGVVDLQNALPEGAVVRQTADGYEILQPPLFLVYATLPTAEQVSADLAKQQQAMEVTG